MSVEPGSRSPAGAGSKDAFGGGPRCNLCGGRGVATGSIGVLNRVRCTVCAWQWLARPWTHVVMFSGGLGSWAAARRVTGDVAGAGHPDRVVLLFADTLVEDADLYRFVSAAARNIGGELVRVADGRTPFEVFRDERFLGNARVASCSAKLKQHPCREWLKANARPSSTTVYVGIDWSESHRLPAIVSGWAPYRVVAPLCDAPYLDKADIEALCEAEGLKPPRAYAEGFSHNNCLEQGCVRGGQAYWANLLAKRPAAYLRSEAAEQDLRDHLDADVAILRDRRGGGTRPLTLHEFRGRVQRQESFDTLEWGGCGCFTEEGIAA